MTAHALNVMLIEDNPADIRLTQEAFREKAAAHRLRAFDNGWEALNDLQRPDTPLPDLILLDLNMPSLNGFEVLAAIRKEKQLRDLPVFILTTSTAKLDRDRCLVANRFITKPVSYEGFLHIVEQIIMLEPWNRTQ